MESPYNSDVSEDTRDLISRGLATDIRNYSVRADIETRERASALTRNMNTSYVRPPVAHVVQVEEPSARVFDMACGDNVKGKNYNITSRQRTNTTLSREDKSIETHQQFKNSLHSNVM